MIISESESKIYNFDLQQHTWPLLSNVYSGRWRVGGPILGDDLESDQSSVKLEIPSR